MIALLNRVSNALVRLCKVTSRDELTSVHNREQLTHLVEESQRLGPISEAGSALITRSLAHPGAPVRDLAVPPPRSPRSTATPMPTTSCAPLRTAAHRR
ncbi:hypothetical protein ACFU53_23655 [Streptomyces sp. NPDC057474]|uniref:hypothetical protein n=1 Tax=Streptomyces sp. NPDC057474 TaxID=3346144 RepID=UPI0036AB5796